MNSKAIISKRSSKAKGMKCSRKYRCNYIVVDAFIDDMAMRLFYVRSGKRAPWCGMLATDTDLDFHKAYGI